MGATSKKQPLYGQLVDSLREKIETEYEPGDLLPSERELSEDYCISRTTVRLALKELETLGFIKRRHGKGTFVADRSQETTNLTRASASRSRCAASAASRAPSSLSSAPARHPRRWPTAWALPPASA